MKNIILFVLINFFFLGYANSQTHGKGGANNIEITNDIEVQTSSSSNSSPIGDKPKTEKIVPVTLVDKGIWVGHNNQLNNRRLEEKTLAKKTTDKKLVPVTLVDKGVWVGDKKQPDNLVLTENTLNELRKKPADLTTGDDTIDSYIADSAARYNIDPLLIYAQMQQESGFKLRATSYKGARGLMQLMPATAVRFGVRNIYDPRQNIEAGIKYMRWLMDKFHGDEELALAGYNAGEAAVVKYGNKIPPYKETRQYVKRIIAHYKSIKSRK